MTEYEDQDDLEVEDSDLRAELDELRETVETKFSERERIAEINAELDAFQREHGIRLDRQTAQAMGESMELEGADVVDAYNATVETDFEEVFDRAVQKVEAREGRGLLDSEVQKLWEASVNEDDPEHIEPGAIRDLSTRRGRIDHVNERIAGPQETPEAIPPLAEDSGPKERAAFIDARVAGAEVEAPDTEYAGDE